jgi:hypothetical protein
MNDAPDEQVYGSTNPKTRVIWDTVAKMEHSVPHLLSHWPCYVPRINVIRFLAHYELFRLVQDMPGDVVELGVCRGVSFFSWCKFLEILCPTDTSRKVIGFDSFEGLQDFDDADGDGSTTDDKRVGGWWAPADEVRLLNELHNADNVVARQRGILVKGRVQESIKPFLAARPGMRISLLHFDLDLHEPTLYALQMLYDLVLPGGIVVFDEYALPPWSGETQAWDEFAASHGIRSRMQKIPWTLTPNAFFVKE